MNRQSLEHRYWTIDALRGIAASAVVFYHISYIAVDPQSSAFSSFIYQVLRFGFLGVPIFFVISGFVIAASVARDAVTFGYFGKFLLKRSIRLDPTYWASIALDVALTAIALRFALSSTPLPDTGKVLLHLFYLQDLTGVGNIASVYWTLCYEMQFYFVFCAMLLIHNLIAARWPGNPIQGNLRLWLFGAVTVYSMLISAQLIPTPLPGLFVTYWSLFALGIAAYQWGIRAPSDRRIFFAFMAAMFAVLACQVQVKGPIYSLNLAAACAVAIGLYIGGRQKKLHAWLNSSVLLYLGARSYSIYLFHTIVGERLTGVTARVMYPRLGIDASTPIWSMVTLLVGVAVSLCIAEVAYRLIEYPSQRLSKRIHPGTGSTAITSSHP